MFFFSEYLGRVAPSVMVEDLMSSLSVNAFSLGTLSAFFHLAYVGMQLPVGGLVDRYGTRLLLTFSSAVCGIGCILFAKATNLWVAEIARFIMGFGASFAFVGALKIVTIWFPSKQFGLLAGLTQSLGMLGAATAQGTLTKTVEVAGWQVTMNGIGLLLLVLALCIWVIVRDYPEGYKIKVERVNSGQELWKGLLAILQNRQTWWNALYVGFVYASTEAFAELWGVSYLEQVYHISVQVAGMAVGMIFLGWTVGGPLAGWFSDRSGHRKPVMLLSSMLSLFMIMIVLYVPHLNLVVLFVMLFLYGVSNTGVGVSYALAAEINPNKFSGISIAFANMASVIIGALAQPIIGWILDFKSTLIMNAGLPVKHIYTAHTFKIAMVVLPVCLLISIVACWGIKETYCQPCK